MVELGQAGITFAVYRIIMNMKFSVLILRSKNKGIPPLNFFSSTILIIVTINVILFAEEVPMERKPFSIPLPNMTCSFDSITKNIEAFVAYDGSKEGWRITSGDDQYVKDTKKARIDHTYKEFPSQAPFISAFEAGVLAEVCNRMAETFLILEKDLKQKRWDRCLFLDAYLPNFLNRFYHLYCAAQSDPNALPAVVYISDTLYEVSEKSLKSDQRINIWRSDTNHIMKLRITSKELSHQLMVWRSEVLLNPQRDTWDNKTEELTNVYELFVRLYFNLPKKK